MKPPIRSKFPADRRHGGRPLHWFGICTLAACAAALWAGGVQAQVRSVQPVPQPAPSAATRPNIGLPSPSGLSSPSPFPAGLPPVAVPGSASPTGAPGVLPPTGVPPVGALDNNGPGGVPGGGTGVPGVPGVGDDTGSLGNPTAVLGAGAGSGVPPTAQSVPLGSGPYTPVQVARSFINADANRDGEITRGEWPFLSIRPAAFETMDRDFDGRISRFEYQDGVR